jgi:cytochrome c oxidase assembly protein Cox11
MNLSTTEWVILSTVFCLTWLVFVLGMAKLSKFYLEFRKLKKTTETSLSGFATNLRQIQVSMSEQVMEQRRANKLMVELIDKTGQMVYEYEIEEEEVEVPAGSSTAPVYELDNGEDIPIEFIDPPRPEL